MGLLMTIEPASATPRYRQIMNHIVSLVDAGTLRPGDRLPATRRLADRLGVNRSTVYRAYQELWSLGYLESRPGGYSTVRRRPPLVSTHSAPRRRLIRWGRRATAASRSVYRDFHAESRWHRRSSSPGIVNFIPLSPDSRLFPIDAFRKSMNRVLGREGRSLLQYGDVLGYGPLRKAIAERMRLHGMAAASDQIMITTGAQHAIELILKLLVSPGAGVVLESPTYPRAIELCRLNRARILGVGMAADGMDLDALERTLSGDTAAMVYTVPNFHNPTGITTGQAHRERLLGICRQHSVPIVEDGFEEEMKYFGKAVLPIKSMDRQAGVIYLGTFSKILFPGLRIGWIAADRACIRRLIPIQRTSILSGNLLDQAALADFCRRGRYDLHVRRMHRVYRKRMHTALQAMDDHLPGAGVTWTRPAGGYTIWLELGRVPMSEHRVVSRLLAAGVAVMPGSVHFPTVPDRICLRLSIAHLDEAAIVEGFKRLGTGLAAIFNAAQ